MEKHSIRHDPTPGRQRAGRGTSRPLIGLCVSVALILLGLGCNQMRRAAAPTQPTESQRMLIGGKEPVTLTRLQTDGGILPEFISATMLPGRGMNVLQITAYIPGRGVTELLASPPLEDVAAKLDGTGKDKFGDLSYSMGGAFLVPYPGRIRGQVNEQNQTVTTSWRGHSLTLPANSPAAKPGGEPVALHGLILDKPMDTVETNIMPDGGVATATYAAGDFGGHWLSQTDLKITIVLSGRAFDAIVTAKNVGTQPEPIAIGWHPYFNIPSHDRQQVVLHIPSETRLEVNNYTDVFPTGRLLPVAGTPYDFSRPGGARLDHTYLDDSYVQLRPGFMDNGPVVEMRDRAANYGLRVEALSSNIKSIQIYSPTDKDFVAIEPQFNRGDPFGKEWKDQESGMQTLDPGKSVTWKVRLELFVPDMSAEPKPDSDHPANPGASADTLP